MIITRIQIGILFTLLLYILLPLTAKSQSNVMWRLCDEFDRMDSVIINDASLFSKAKEKWAPILIPPDDKPMDSVYLTELFYQLKVDLFKNCKAFKKFALITYEIPEEIYVMHRKLEIGQLQLMHVNLDDRETVSAALKILKEVSSSTFFDLTDLRGDSGTILVRYYLYAPGAVREEKYSNLKSQENLVLEIKYNLESNVISNFTYNNDTKLYRNIMYIKTLEPISPPAPEIKE